MTTTLPSGYCSESCGSLCHKGDFNPSWMVNAVLLLDLFYVTLICTLGQEPKIFIELFFRDNSSWWLKIYLFRLIHIFQSIYPLCIYKPSYVTLIGCIMPFCSIPIHLLPDKRHPRAAEISIILHQNYFKIWGVLGVPVSYEITRGIKLDVGRVTERVNGVFWGV